MRKCARLIVELMRNIRVCCDESADHVRAAARKRAGLLWEPGKTLRGEASRQCINLFSGCSERPIWRGSADVFEESVQAVPLQTTKPRFICVASTVGFTPQLYCADDAQHSKQPYI